MHIITLLNLKQGDINSQNLIAYGWVLKANQMISSGIAKFR